MSEEELDILWFKAMRQSVEENKTFIRYHFAALVAAAEREACAKVCDENGDKWADGNDEWRNGQATASYYCAIAIRARGET